MPTVTQPSWQAPTSDASQRNAAYTKVPDLACKPDIMGAIETISDRKELERFVKALMLASWNKFEISLDDRNDLLEWCPKDTMFYIAENSWGEDADGRDIYLREFSFAAPCDMRVLEALVVIMCEYLSFFGEDSQYWYVKYVDIYEEDVTLVFFELRLR